MTPAKPKRQRIELKEFNLSAHVHGEREIRKLRRLTGEQFFEYWWCWTRLMAWAGPLGCGEERFDGCMGSDARLIAETADWFDDPEEFLENLTAANLIEHRDGAWWIAEQDVRQPHLLKQVRKIETARENGSRGGRPRSGSGSKPSGNQGETDRKPSRTKKKPTATKGVPKGTEGKPAPTQPNPGESNGSGSGSGSGEEIPTQPSHGPGKPETQPNRAGTDGGGAESGSGPEPGGAASASPASPAAPGAPASAGGGDDPPTPISRAAGTNPRSQGTNPRAQGTNPLAGTLSREDFIEDCRRLIRLHGTDHTGPEWPGGLGKAVFLAALKKATKLAWGAFCRVRSRDFGKKGADVYAELKLRQVWSSDQPPSDPEEAASPEPASRERGKDGPEAPPVPSRGALIFVLKSLARTSGPDHPGPWPLAELPEALARIDLDWPALVELGEQGIDAHAAALVTAITAVRAEAAGA